MRRVKKKNNQKRVKKRNKGGRPVIFSNDIMDQTYRAAAIFGANDKQLAEFLGVGESTLNYWKRVYPEFKRVLEQGKMEADVHVAEALYKCAVGYEYNDYYVTVDPQGHEHIIPKKVKVPANYNAAYKWLNVRQRSKWADPVKVQHDHTGTVDHRHYEELPLDELSEKDVRWLDEITDKQLKRRDNDGFEDAKELDDE